MTTSTFPSISKLLKTILLATACFAAVWAQTPAIAQSDQEAADSELLEEIVVTGIRSSLDSAAQIKRNADQMVDAITAEDIGLFSDNNIGEALQRIPGVQLERDAGEGFRISIRGLGPRFVRTTVNGRTALSTAGGEDGNSEDSRGFTLNMIPSEVITRVTVEKSTMARNLEGGIGGTLDLQTNRPLDFVASNEQDFYISTAFRAGDNDLVDDTLLRGSVFVNQKFSDNFGAFLGIVLDDGDRVDSALETGSLRVRDNFNIDKLTPGTLLNGTPMTQADIDALHASTQGVGPNGEDAGLNFLNSVRNTAREFDRDRQTYTGGLQWQSGNWDTNFDWTYGRETNDQILSRFALDPDGVALRDEKFVTSLTVDFGDEDLTRTAPTLGTVTAFEFEGARGDDRVDSTNRIIPREQKIHVGGLNVEWSNDLWTVNADVGYAEQKTERLDDLVSMELDGDDKGRGDPRFVRMNGSFDSTGAIPTATLIGVDAAGNLTPFDPTDVSLFFFEQAQRTFTQEMADDISVRLDLTREIEGGGFFDALMAGFSWNERNGTRIRQRFREERGQIQEAALFPPDGDAIPAISLGDDPDDLTLFSVSNFLPGVSGVNDFIFIDPRDPIFDPLFKDTPLELLPFDFDQGYDVTEEVTAVYIQAPFSGGDSLPFRGNIGVRYVSTSATGIGTFGEGDEVGDGEPRITRRSYTDVLPSANIAFDINDTVVLRFAANKSLTRPDPKDMASFIDLNDVDEGDEGRGKGGNPDLESYETYSFDGSLEWYPESGGSYAIGVFYKKMDGWIAQGRNDEVFNVPVVLPDGSVENRDVIFSIRRKVNTDGGDIRGFEFGFHQPFDAFSSGFLQYFGVNGSVTYVDAEIDAVVPENNLPISLRGTSEWSGNLVGYFEKGKFGVRVAYNYRDDFLFQEAEDPERHAEWTEGSEILDLSLNYRFTKNVRLRLSANNLTGETRQRYWETVGTNRFSDLRDNGQSYFIEIRMRN